MVPFHQGHLPSTRHINHKVPIYKTPQSNQATQTLTSSDDYLYHTSGKKHLVSPDPPTTPWFKMECYCHQPTLKDKNLRSGGSTGSHHLYCQVLGFQEYFDYLWRKLHKKDSLKRHMLNSWAILLADESHLQLTDFTLSHLFIIPIFGLSEE